MNNLKPKSRQNNIVVQELKGELLIYDLKTNKAYCLNETSALVWQLCNGERTVAEISKQLSRKLKQTASEEMVWLAIDDLKKQNLLENSQQITINYNGLSRREVIRKVGLASMLALPIVSSLVAPTAAMAQSGCRTVGQSCTPANSLGNCCFGTGYCGSSICVQCKSSGSAPFSCTNRTQDECVTYCQNNASYTCCSGNSTPVLRPSTNFYDCTCT